MQQASCLLRGPTLSPWRVSLSWPLSLSETTPCSGAALAFWDGPHSVYGMCISLNKSTSYLKKLKTQLCDSAIPPLAVYPKKIKTLIQKDTYTPIFIAVSFTITKIRKQPVSINRWTNKEDVECIYIHIYNVHTHIYIIYTHMYNIHSGVLLSHKKKDILLFATTWMDLEGIMLSEISQRKTNTIFYQL